MPPRVLVVSPLYHPDRGGLGRQAVSLTERLARLGVPMQVVSRRMRGLPAHRFSPLVPVHRVPAPRPAVHNYEEPNVENFVTSLAFSLGLVSHMVRERRRIDLVHVHGASLPLLVLLPVAKLLGLPVLALVAATHQGVEAGDVRARYGKVGRFLAWAFSCVDGYIAITQEIALLLEGEGVPRERVVRVPFFVDGGDFKPLPDDERARVRRELGFEGRTVVVASGRLVPRKGGDGLIRAFARARERASETRPLLVFLGDGPERPGLERLAQELGQGEAVRFQGFVADVPRWLAASDVNVLASRIEGLPNALLEALAMGLPCIATRIAGAEEVIEDGRNGLLVPPDDDVALASAIERLLRDEPFRRSLGEAAVSDVRSRLAPEAIVPRYLSIYEDLVLGRGIGHANGNGHGNGNGAKPAAPPLPAKGGKEDSLVSFVVPIFDAQETLARSVECILRQETTRRLEVVLVDDGSRDASPAIARTLAEKNAGKVRFLRKANGGEASALNVGFREAKGDLIAIVEADVEIAPDWLEKTASVLERESEAIACGGYLETPREDPWIARLAGYEIERKFATRPRDVKHLTSANVLYRREAWTLAGPFDERLVNASLDSVFNGRLIRAGKRLVYEPGARCRHHYKTTFPAYLRRQYAYARFRVHNEVRDLYPADRWLAVHVAVSALAFATIVLSLLALPLLPASAAATVAALGPIALAFALAIEVPAAVEILARTRDLAALLYPPVVVLRNVVGAIGYAVGMLRKDRDAATSESSSASTTTSTSGKARPPRVLVVAPLYHTDRGGLGRQAVLLTEKLAAKGVPMQVATRRMRGLPRRAFSAEVPIHHVPAPRPGVHNYEVPNLENLVTSLAFALGLALLVIRRRRQIDVIHVHGASLPLLVLLPVAKLLGIPVLAKVAATHQGLEAGDVRRHYGPLGRGLAWLFARVEGYVATTTEIAHMLEADGVPAARIARVPNFVDVETFRPLPPAERARARRELGLEGRTTVVASGRLAARKGGAVLVRAFARARALAPGSSPLLVFLGDGPERKRLEQLSHELGLGDSVRFEGFVDDVPRRLGAADVLVLASRIEGFPNALLEGLATGLACVSTRIGGGEEATLDGKTGLLVPPDDAEALGDAIARLLQDEPLRRALGEQAARDVRARFALEGIAPRYLSIYRGLTARDLRAAEPAPRSLALA